MADAADLVKADHHEAHEDALVVDGSAMQPHAAAQVSKQPHEQNEQLKAEPAEASMKAEPESEQPVVGAGANGGLAPSADDAVVVPAREEPESVVEVTADAEKVVDEKPDEQIQPAADATPSPMPAEVAKPQPTTAATTAPPAVSAPEAPPAAPAPVPQAESAAPAPVAHAVPAPGINMPFGAAPQLPGLLQHALAGMAAGMPGMQSGPGAPAPAAAFAPVPAPAPPPVRKPPPPPPPPPKVHTPEHLRGWTPLEVAAPRARRSPTQPRLTPMVDVLLSCSDGDMPDFLRHRGTALVFYDDSGKPKTEPRQKVTAAQTAAARAEAAQQRRAAQEAAAEEEAVQRSHGYSTRKRNATRNFKALYADLVADEDDEEGDEDEKMEKMETDEESSSESGLDSDDSEMGRVRKARRAPPPRPAQTQQRQAQQPQKAQQAQQQQRMHQSQAAAQMHPSMAQQQQQQQQQLMQQRMLMQQQAMQQQGGNYGGFAAAGGNAALQQQMQMQQMNQLMTMLTPQEQQMVQMMPPQQRFAAALQVVQNKRARQQAAAAQAQRPGMEAMGFVPNGGGGMAAGANRGVPGQPAAAVGMYNLGGMRQAAPQQGMGLQLPGMLGQQAQQQQPSINPFTGGGNMQQQYRF